MHLRLWLCAGSAIAGAMFCYHYWRGSTDHGHAVQPEVAKTGAAKPEAAQPEAAQPEAVKPEAATQAAAASKPEASNEAVTAKAAAEPAAASKAAPAELQLESETARAAAAPPEEPATPSQAATEAATAPQAAEHGQQAEAAKADAVKPAEVEPPTPTAPSAGSTAKAADSTRAEQPASSGDKAASAAEAQPSAARETASVVVVPTPGRSTAVESARSDSKADASEESFTAAASAADVAAVTGTVACSIKQALKEELQEILRKGNAKAVNSGSKVDLLGGTFRDLPPSPPPAPAPAAAPKAAAAVPPPPPKAKVVEVNENWDDESNPPSPRGPGPVAGHLGGASSTGSKGESPFAAMADSARKVYTRDFMIGLKDKLPKDTPPPSLKQDGWTLDRNEPTAGPSFNRTMSRSGGSSSSGNGSSGGGGRLDRMGSDNQGSRRGPPPPGSVPGAFQGFALDPRLHPGPGPRGGPMPPADARMGREGSLRRGMPDSGRWEQRGPLQAALFAGGRARNLPALHKTDNRYKAGETRSEDPEEERKQKEFKGVLNKLTPDNFEKLLQKLLDVGINEAKTLEGLIDQVFDKAINEPHFCELYSQLCNLLQRRLPEFDDPDSPEGEETKRKITFRRLLLNKCQEEFEKGDAAMQAVADRESKDREKRAAGSDDEEEDKDDDEEEEEAPEAEEGELVSPSAVASQTEEECVGKAAKAAKAAAKADRAAADNERKARRRMLGNIQFIGHLYRYSMLTEIIMHSCILRLMVDDQNPKGEDLECLCKLLSTVGAQLENPQPKPNSKQDPRILQASATRQMDAYFLRVKRLTGNQLLESRLRFMLLDIIEQRMRGWEVRRKADGPKKIEEVHKEARREAVAVTRRGSMGPPPDRNPRPYCSSGPGGGDGRDGRTSHLRRDDLPTQPMMQMSGRIPSEDLNVRSMGHGFGMKNVPPMRAGEIRRGASGPAPHEHNSLSGPPATPPRPPALKVFIPESVRAAAAKAAASVAPPPARSAAGSVAAIAPAAPAAAAAGVPQLGKEALTKVKGIARALVEQSNQEEALDSLKALAEGAAPMGAVVKELLAAALDTRGVPVEERMECCKGFVAQQITSAKGIIKASHLASGIIAFIGNLPDLMEDVPKAPAIIAKFVGGFVAEGQVLLWDFVTALLAARSANSNFGDDEEEVGAEEWEPVLVEQNVAAPTVLQILAAVKEHKGEAAAKAVWNWSGVSLPQLLPADASDAAEQSRVLAKHNAVYLAA